MIQDILIVGISFMGPLGRPQLICLVHCLQEFTNGAMDWMKWANKKNVANDLVYNRKEDDGTHESETGIFSLAIKP